MPDWIFDAIIAFALGLGGGVLRVIIGGSVVWPHRRSGEDDRPGFELGSLSTVLAGGAAGFVLWALVTRQLFADQGFGVMTVAATVLVGLGGGDSLMSYLDRRLGISTAQDTGEAVQDQAKALRNYSEGDQRSRERQEALEDENKRLKEELARLKDGDTGR